MTFQHEIHPDGFILHLPDAAVGRVPFESWTAKAPSSAGIACASLSALREESQEDLLRDAGRGFLLPHAAAARLPEMEARVLGLPERSPFTLSIEHRGTLGQPNFQFKYQFFEPDGRPVIAPKRIGAAILLGNRHYRLSDAHFALLDGIDEFNALLGDSLDERMRVFARFEDYLSKHAQEAVRVTGYLTSTHVAVAGAFSLKLRVADGRFTLEPVLHARKPATQASESSEPELLPPEQQERFHEQHAKGQQRYALGGQHFLVLQPELQTALDLVKEMQSRGDAQQTEFFRNPRGFLRAAYGELASEDALETLFIETPQYLSDRVKGIGQWDPPVIPWVRLPSNPWLPPEEVGIEVEGLGKIPVPVAELPRLIEKVEQAISKNEPTVEHDGQSLPATDATLSALKSAQSLTSQTAEDIRKGAKDTESRAGERTVLIIERDFLEIEEGRNRTVRSSSVDLMLPIGLASSLKGHQEVGLRWLQEAWRSGRSGVLLADDMGLGKTLQCLAFLLWLRQVRPQSSGNVAGFLIVAPTGLLKNWEQEFEKHLDESGRRQFGPPLRAYGQGLARLRHGTGNDLTHGGVTLKPEDLTAAGWVLTTYETLRDYQHSFATIHWQAMVLDEVQKTKTPGTLVTEAVKAMNADFTMALTGTPIENRYADLWCIVNTIDRHALGHLGGGTLREFSAKFERDPDEKDLRELRKFLLEPGDGSPALMLRRMKQDIIEGLPSKTEYKRSAMMSQEQAVLYSEAVERARTIRVRGKMLEALHEFRKISLHPWLASDEERDDLNGFVSSSARVTECFKALEEIRKLGEKVLLFVDSRRMQKWMRVAIQSAFSLPELPVVLSGEVPGPKRQEIVNRFQNLPPGFAVILLSPRAAGIGLTLTAANHVIHLERWWNPAVEDQCTDRVYRIGQDKAVHVILPLAQHPDPKLAPVSFDLTLDQLMTRKRVRSREILDPPSLGDGEAEELFKRVCGAE